MQVEIGELALEYAGLRVQDRRRQARLSASLAEHGQQSPVLVVETSTPSRLVLIDGYLRVEALRQLARDVVEALRLDLSEVVCVVTLFDGDPDTLVDGDRLTLPPALATRAPDPCGGRGSPAAGCGGAVPGSGSRRV